MSGHDKHAERLARIERARAELAAAYAADPAAVQRINQRMARFAQARKREQQRFDHLVLGKPRPAATDLPPRPEGMTRREWKAERQRLVAAGAKLEPGIEEAVALRERYSHKANATPQTLALAGLHHDGLEQLVANGTITKAQREWAAQIANVHRSIEADVGIKIASLEARVDSSSRPPQVAERIHRVRMHHAYTVWRDMLPAPKALVLDMIVGDAIGYTVAARRHRVHKRKAKRFLLQAIERWPLCVAHAFSEVAVDIVDAMNDARKPWSAGVRVWSYPRAVVHAESYEAARASELGREETDEPYLLPLVDPIFLDDNGYLKPWADIAEIVRSRAFEIAPLPEQSA